MSNMRQIARLAGVSLTTVSLALRDKPGIANETREKVQRVARQLDYALSRPAAPEIAGGNVIGYVVHEWFGAIATHILRGATAEARRRRLGLMLMEVAQDPQWIEEGIRSLLDLGVRGLVIAHVYPRLPHRSLLALHSRDVHVVQVMHRIFAEPLDAVCRNEPEYARVAADHLRALGHRRVLALNLQEHYLWEQVLRRHDIAPVSMAGHGAEKMATVAGTFLRLSPRPTAIVASCDEDAYRLYHLLREQGLRVPEDVSIMGMGNIDRAHLYPEITTIEMHASEMGRLGVSLLADRIAAGVPPHAVADFQDIRLPAAVMPRRSTGPAPGQTREESMS